MASGVGKISWQKTGNAQWTANTQTRSAVDYSAVINFASNTYTLTVNSTLYTYGASTLKLAKNEFAKFLRDK